MKFTIKVYNEQYPQNGKMSKKAYNKIPEYKRKYNPDGLSFNLGDIIKPTVTILILDDDSLDENSIYLHQQVITNYYTNKKYIEF